MEQCLKRGLLYMDNVCMMLRSTDDPVTKAYKFLKKRGWSLPADLTALYGEEIVEALRRKDMITFNIIDGVEYVNAK